MFFISFQLCLFAEGTRFTKEKHKVSVQFSKENGFPVLKHHLLPRPKGFTFLVNNLNDTSNYYNIIIIVIIIIIIIVLLLLLLFS